MTTARTCSRRRREDYRLVPVLPNGSDDRRGESWQRCAPNSASGSSQAQHRIRLAVPYPVPLGRMRSRVDAHFTAARGAVQHRGRTSVLPDGSDGPLLCRASCRTVCHGVAWYGKSQHWIRPAASYECCNRAEPHHASPGSSRPTRAPYSTEAGQSVLPNVSDGCLGSAGLGIAGLRSPEHDKAQHRIRLAARNTKSARDGRLRQSDKLR